MFAKLKSTIHEILDSKKAVMTIVSALSIVLTGMLTFLFMHFGSRLGLSPELQAKIPDAAFWLSTAIVGLAAAYNHGQGLADTGKEAAAIRAVFPNSPPAVDSPEFQALIKAAADAALAKAGIPEGMAAALAPKIASISMSASKVVAADLPKP